MIGGNKDKPIYYYSSIAVVLLPPGGDINYFTLYIWRPCLSRGSTDFSWRLWYSLLTTEARDKGMRTFSWWNRFVNPTCIFSLRRWKLGQWLSHEDEAFINGIGALPQQKDPRELSHPLSTTWEYKKSVPWRRAPTGFQPGWHLALGPPELGVKTFWCISHPVYSTLLIALWLD